MTLSVSESSGDESTEDEDDDEDEDELDSDLDDLERELLKSPSQRIYPNGTPMPSRPESPTSLVGNLGSLNDLQERGKN